MDYNSHVNAYYRNGIKEGYNKLQGMNMDVFGVGTFLAGLADTIGRGIIDKKNFDEMKRQYEQNMQFQREQFDYTKANNDRNFKYQEWLNNKTMEREDTAVRRKMTDLKAAGLNPLMADGQGASSSGMSTAGGNSTSFSGTNAAQRNYSIDTPTMISALLDSRRVKNEISQTKLEKERLENQILDSQQNRLESISRQILNAKSVEEKNALINQYNASINLINKQARKVGIESDYLEWDMSIDKGRGTKSSENTSSDYNNAKDFFAGTKNGEGKNPIVETVNKAGNTASPIKKGTIDSLNEYLGKKPVRSYLRRKSDGKYFYRKHNKRGWYFQAKDGEIWNGSAQ